MGERAHEAAELLLDFVRRSDVVLAQFLWNGVVRRCHCLARGRAAQRFDIVVAIARRRIGARLIPAVFVGVWEASLDEVDAVGVIDGQAAIGQRNCTCLLYTSPGPRDS